MHRYRPSSPPAEATGTAALHRRGCWILGGSSSDGGANGHDHRDPPTGSDNGSRSAGRRRPAAARREWGRPDGRPILFLHGWFQSHLCWAEQYHSALAQEFRLVASDLRGHGMLEAPPNPGHYTNGRLWADDLAAIIDQLGLDRPVLVGWSYGGFIICDYLRAHGTGQPGQPVVAGVATTLGEAASGR